MRAVFPCTGVIHMSCWLNCVRGCFVLLPDPTFFPGRAATIYYRLPKEATGLTVLKRTLKTALNRTDDLEIGVLGILHPTVLEKFEITYPCSALEFTLEPFKKDLQTVWT